MKPVLNFITIGVKDLDKAKRFYIEKFGWTPIKDDQGIVFFKLNGFIFSLFPTEELAKDAGVDVEGNGFRGFTLAINFNSEAEVDKAFAELREKGVLVVKEPQKVFWGGYSGYIQDDEGNLWELAHNPFLELDEDGNVVAHG